MRKKIFLTESELVSLIKSTIMEAYIHQKSLTYDQKKKIKNLGVEVFDFIKEYKEGDKDINYWLNNKGLFLKVPDVVFLDRNIEDVTFALEKLPLSSSNKTKLEEHKALLELQKKNLEENHILLFHEQDGSWSVVNMFDNNIKLWLNLMNRRLNGIDKKINVDKFIDYFFENYAKSDLLRAMADERVSIEKNILSSTLGVGQRIESDFFNLLNSNNFETKIFSGGGNFVDRSNIDGAIKCKGKWIPIQVKSNKADAKDAIPFGGIAVYEEERGSGFFFIRKYKNPEEGKIEDFLNQC